jgi:hypothetical protein
VEVLSLMSEERRSRKGATVGCVMLDELQETPCRVRDEGTCFEPTVKEKEPAPQRGVHSPASRGESLKRCQGDHLISQVQTSSLKRHNGGGFPSFPSSVAALCQSR